jgi:hypothetical protein
MSLTFRLETHNCVRNFNHAVTLLVTNTHNYISSRSLSKVNANYISEKCFRGYGSCWNNLICSPVQREKEWRDTVDKKCLAWRSKSIHFLSYLLFQFSSHLLQIGSEINPSTSNQAIVITQIFIFPPTSYSPQWFIIYCIRERTNNRTVVGQTSFQMSSSVTSAIHLFEMISEIKWVLQVIRWRKRNYIIGPFKSQI